MTEPVVLVQGEGRICRLILNRPRQGNALDVALVFALELALDEAQACGAELLTISGAGKHFCTGFDLSNLEAETDDSLLARFTRIELLLQRLARMPMATCDTTTHPICMRLFGPPQVLVYATGKLSTWRARWRRDGQRRNDRRSGPDDAAHVDDVHLPALAMHGIDGHLGAVPAPARMQVAAVLLAETRVRIEASEIVAHSALGVWAAETRVVTNNAN